MCRNIRTLFNFEPPATDDEIRAASLQFVRKLSGFTTPSRTNEAVFQRSVDEVLQVARRLIDSLVTTAPARDRAVEAAKAKARGAARFGRSSAADGRRPRGGRAARPDVDSGPARSSLVGGGVSRSNRSR
jgi:hypothetical protein